MFDGKYLEWNQRRIKCIIDYYGHKFMYMKKLLDLGCGQADISGAMYRLGADVTAVDARQEHLTIASKKFQGIKTVKADIERAWPFVNQKFDITLDLALLCHIRDFESHLVSVCASTNFLVLETAVCDSNDPNKVIIIDESKAIYDNAINGVGCRPSAEAIEKVLSNCGMSFIRMDNARLNAGPFVYDWQVQNTDDTSINKRRMWFCGKSGNRIIQASKLPRNGQVESNNTFQPAHRHTAIARPPPVTPPTVTTEVVTSYLPNNNANLITNVTTEDVKTMSRRFAISPSNVLNRRPDLKVLYLPLGEQPGMVDAWNNVGVQLKVFDFWGTWSNNGRNTAKINQQFLDYVRDFQPNLVHMQLQITGVISPETIVQAKKLAPKAIFTNWSGDIRTHVIHEMNTMSRVIDYTLLSSTGQLDLYQRAGVQNARYWQVGYDPKWIYPKHYSDFTYDVSFIANSYGNQFPDSQLRSNAVLKCQQVFGNRFGLFGAGWAGNPKQCESKECNEIYNRSVCALSISNFNNVSHYFSDRLLSCVASGRPTISWYYPGIESYFQEGTEIFIAKTNEDIINLVNYCKNNPDKANAVGAAGGARARAEHTFTSKVYELIHIVGLDK